MIPLLLNNPTVGFMPTTPLYDAGEIIDPSVSVPIATAHRFAATATADPELDPDALRSRIYGFLVSPPLLLHPLTDQDPLKFDHSLKLVLPNNTAPAFLNCCTINASIAAL
jgi:hypothetical protein